MSDSPLIPFVKKHPDDHVSPHELRELFRANGFTRRQITVAQGRGTAFTTVTVRDPDVDIRKVWALVDPLDTFSTDHRGTSTGQGIFTNTTRKVDEAHATPYVGAIRAAVESMIGVRRPKILAIMEVAFLECEDGHFRVYHATKRHLRGPTRDRNYTETLDANAIHDLALDVYDLTINA